MLEGFLGDGGGSVPFCIDHEIDVRARIAVCPEGPFNSLPLLPKFA